MLLLSRPFSLVRAGDGRLTIPEDDANIATLMIMADRFGRFVIAPQPEPTRNSGTSAAHHSLILPAPTSGSISLSIPAPYILLSPSHDSVLKNFSVAVVSCSTALGARACL